MSWISHKYIVGATVCLVAIAIWWFSWETKPTQTVIKKTQAPPTLSKRNVAVDAVQSAKEKGSEIATPNPAKFKQKWLELNRIHPLKYTISEAHRHLADETVAELLCTKDTVDLIEFLEREGLGGANIVFDDAISKLLRSEKSAEARKTLVALPVDRRKVVSGTNGKVKGPGYREEWSYEAGLNCPPEELEAFQVALGDPACSRNALLGANFTLSKSDPFTAITSILEILQPKLESSKSNIILKEVIDSLPEDTDFAAINALFDARKTEDSSGNMSSIDQGRDRLLSRWAKNDPAAGANYVLSFPEELNPSFMTAIASTLASQNPASALDWIQNLPAGPHFDNAAIAVIVNIAENFPKEANELASLISDPSIRKQQLKLVEGIQARAKTRGIE